MSRRELDNALSDFHRLGNDVRFERVGEGVRLTSVTRGSLPHRMGLLRGDVIIAVAGRRIDTEEGAADAYVAISGSERFTIELIRNGTATSLHFRIENGP